MENLLQTLEKLFLSDIEYVEAKAVFGQSKLTKKDREILEDLLKQGYIETQDRGNKKVYGITLAGKDLLQKDTERWDYLTHEKNMMQRQRVRDFLSIIKEKPKNALSAAVQKKFASELHQCLDNKTLEQISENKYSLTREGEALWLSLQPGRDILAKMKGMLESVVQEFKDFHQAQESFAKEFSKEEPGIKEFLKHSLDQIAGNLSLALREMDETQKHIEKIEIAHEVKENVRDKIEKTKLEFQNKTEDIRASVNQRYGDSIIKLKESIDQERSLLKTDNQRLENKVDDLKKLYDQVLVLLNKIKDEKPLPPPKDSVKPPIVASAIQNGHPKPVVKECDHKPEIEVVVDDEIQAIPENAKNFLEQVRDYYQLTYWQHHGLLGLKDVLDYHERTRGYSRDWMKQHLLSFKNQGFIKLKQAVEIERFQERDIIRDGEDIYFAIQIPDLMDF